VFVNEDKIVEGIKVKCSSQMFGGGGGGGGGGSGGWGGAIEQCCQYLQ
jgi:hypothetical protein